MGLPDLQQIVTAATFTGLRIGGVMTFAPFTGSDGVSIPVKAILTLLVTALVYPVSPIVGMNLNGIGWAKVAAGEAVIGLAMGLLLQFSFEAAQLAGQIFGMQTGFSLIALLDPQTQADSPSLSVFTRLMATVFYLEANVHHWVLRGVTASFNYLPPGGLVNLRLLNTGILRSAAGLWLAGLQMAAPVLAVTMLVEIAMGVIGKAAPMFPATLAALPVKSILGLVTMALIAKSWPSLFEHQFANAISEAERLLHFAR